MYGILYISFKTEVERDQFMNEFEYVEIDVLDDDDDDGGLEIEVKYDRHTRELQAIEEYCDVNDLEPEFEEVNTFEKHVKHFE